MFLHLRLVQSIVNITNSFLITVILIRAILSLSGSVLPILR